MALDPLVYARVFEGHHEGKQILEELTGRFHDQQDLFVKGGQDGERATAYNLGARSVVQFILGRLAQAQEVTSE